MSNYFQTGTYSEKQGSRLWWSYYDWAALVSTTLVYNFFSAVRPLLSDGNLNAAGQLPSKHKMAVQGIEIFYQPHAAMTQATYQLFLNFLRKTTLVFWIDALSNQLQLNLFQLFKAHLPLAITGAAAGDQLFLRSGIEGVWQLPIPIVLEENTSFKLPMTCDVAPNAALDTDQIMVSIVGTLDTGR